MIRNQSLGVALLIAFSAFGSERPVASAKPELQIQKIHLSGPIDVVLTPATTGTTRIWRPTNSWGAANWRVIVVREDDLFLFREDPDQVFLRNVAAFDELRSPKEVSLNLQSNVWIGPLAKFGSFRRGDRVMVVYDVAATTEARQRGVWYGTLATFLAVK